MKHGPHYRDVPREELGRLAAANKPYDVWYVCLAVARNPNSCVARVRLSQAAALWGTDERILLQSAVESLDRHTPRAAAAAWLDRRWVSIKYGENRPADALKLVRFWQSREALSVAALDNRAADLVGVGAAVRYTKTGAHFAFDRAQSRTERAGQPAAVCVVDVDPPAPLWDVDAGADDPDVQRLVRLWSHEVPAPPAPPPFDFEAYNGLPPKKDGRR